MLITRCLAEGTQSRFSVTFWTPVCPDHSWLKCGGLQRSHSRNRSCCLSIHCSCGGGNERGALCISLLNTPAMGDHPRASIRHLKLNLILVTDVRSLVLARTHARQ